jgi:hypothetical protein
MTDKVSIQYNFEAQGEVLDAYIRSRARVMFIMGPLGSGKTTGSCWKIMDLMCEQAPNRNGIRKSRWIAVRNTYPDLMGTTAKDWLDMHGDLGDFKQGGMEPPTHYLNFGLPDGTKVEAEMIFMALDRVEHVKKLRGTQATGIYLSEVKELPRAIVDMLDLRHGRYPSLDDGGPSWHGMIGDTNACDSDHWYYALSENNKDPDWQFFRQPGGVIRLEGLDENRRVRWAINPNAENLKVLDQLSPGYYAKGMVNKTDDWIATNLANEYGFVSSGKPVYPDYRDFAHCRPIEIIPSAGPIMVGMDFGLTPAAVFGQKQPSGRWVKRSEIVTEDCTIETFAEMVLYELQNRYRSFECGGVWGDPAGDQRSSGDGRTALQICRTAGLPAKACPFPGQVNEVTLRVEAVNSWFKKQVDGESGMIIHPDCQVLRKAYAGGYCYERVQVLGGEKFKDAPKKNRFSHVADADQYLMLGAGEGKTVTHRRRVEVNAAPRQRFAKTEYDPFR